MKPVEKKPLDPEAASFLPSADKSNQKKEWNKVYNKKHYNEKVGVYFREPVVSNIRIIESKNNGRKIKRGNYY